MPSDPLFPVGTPVILSFEDGSVRHGYYQGLSGWHTHHLVSCTKSSTSGRWRVRDGSRIAIDPHRKKGARR